jgi:AAA domain
MIDATESSDDAAKPNPPLDPLRPAFEAVSAATDARGKLEAIRRTAKDLAQPIRWGDLDFDEIEARLIDLAESHGLPDALTRGAVELVITNALKTPALSDEPTERVNGNAAELAKPPQGDDEPPPPESPDDYGMSSAIIKPQAAVTNLPALIRKFRLVAFDDVQVDTTRRGYLVKGLLASSGLAVVWGPPKCGKSFWAMDIGLHIALGWEYRGHRVQQVPVVYLALEGQEGLPARLEAFKRHHRVKSAPFYLVTSRLNLIADAAALIADIKVQLEDIALGVVFIDTLNRSLVGSESKDEDMGKYLAAADKVATDLKCAVVIVHHCGIDASRPRGHTSLTGSVESQLAVKRAEGGEVCITVEYAKDMPEGAEVFSRLEPVTVGTDPDGDDITTLVVLPADQPSTRGKSTKPVKGAKKVALDLLRKAIDEAGELPPASNHIPANTKVVRINCWQTYAEQGSVSESDKPDHRRRTFARCTKQLQAANLIGIWGDYAWPV